MESKWIATVASMWIQCSCGAYTFGTYSSVLKSSQGYDQSTLNTVSFFKDIGSNAGVLSGLLYSAVTQEQDSRNSSNRISKNFGGTWVVHLTGAIQSFLGYFLMWASVVGLINRPPVPVMCFFMLLASHSQTFFTTANMISGLHNFPDYGGTIVGIMKAFIGISGAILIQVYDTFCKGNPSTFLLILALFPTIIPLLLMCFVRIYKPNTSSDDHDKKHLNGFSAIALIIATFLMITIVLDNIFTLPPWGHTFTFVLLLVLLASPLGIAIKAQREEEENSKRFPQTFSSSESSESKDSIAYRELPGVDEKILPNEEENMNLLQAICTLNFWLLFTATVCGMGSGLAMINNMSQIGQSLNYTNLEIYNLVSLWGIWNFLGRLGAGYLSDYFLHTRGWARPLLMAVTLAAMAAGHIIVASGFPGILYMGSILVGICDGSQWSLMPTIASEIFGVRHVGTIFNTVTIACPVGSYIFSVRLIGYFYDKEASGEDDSCFGTQCFMLSFFIMAFVSFLGFLVAVVLFFRTKRFYQVVVLRRLNLKLSLG